MFVHSLSSFFTPLNHVSVIIVKSHFNSDIQSISDVILGANERAFESKN